jgi:hypothetical protein
MFYAERRADGRRDMTKLIVAFSNFTKAPKKKIHCCFSNGEDVTQCNAIRKLTRTNDIGAHREKECNVCGNTRSTITHIVQLLHSLTLEHSEGGILHRATSTALSNSVRH